MFHSCAITTNGKLLVWGGNRQCQLGYPNRLTAIHRPFMFGGNIEHAAVCYALTEEIPNATMIDSKLSTIYQRVECGQAMTVV